MANGLRGPLRVNGGNALGKAGALRSQDELESPRGGSPAEELFTDHDGSRAARFSTELVGNRFRELQAARPAQREAAIRAGLIHDEENPRAFDDPILLRGTCRDMCPEYEREEREFKKNVDRWELRDGQAGLQGRIDPARAVSAFSRPAAGKDTGDEQVLPSDMRDPETLSRTLDYLFGTILSRPPHDPSIPATPFNSLKATHPFIWDRTRQVRQEFSKQKHWGLEHAVSGHERIARYHILCLRELRKTGINLQQEAEQLRKTLVSLTHYYNDLRMDTGSDMPCANEAEFRAYLLILDMFDPETARATSVLPHAVFSQPILKLAFDLHALVQRNFDSQKAASRGNIQVAQNFASRFFKMVRSQRVPFVMACLLESRFADVRRAGLRALHQSYPKSDDPSKRMSINALLRMFGCVNEDEVVEMVEAVEMEVVYEDEGPVGVFINRSAPYNDNRDPPAAEPWPSITAKQGHASYSEIIDGAAGVQAGPQAMRKPSTRAPTAFTTSQPATTANAFAGFGTRPAATAQSAFSFNTSTTQPLQPSNRQPTAQATQEVKQPLLASMPPSAFSIAKPAPPTHQPTQLPSPVPTASAVKIPTPPPPRPPSPPPVVETHYSDAVAAVADLLISDTVQQVTRDIAEAVLRDLQLEAQRSLQAARAKARSDLLDYTAESLYASMLQIPLRGTAIEAVMREAQHRNLTRHVGRYWREWARLQREDREERQRRRLAFSKRMEDMRLSRRLVSHVDVEMTQDEDQDDDLGVEQMHELRSDLERAEEFRKAQAERALFWEPGTYLEAIANHINALFPRSRRRDSNESDSPVLQRPIWKVMVAATMQDTGNWLRRKLAVGKPPLHCDRVTVHSITAPDRKRPARKAYVSTGLVIFEVSRAATSSDEATRARYLEDKQRFEHLQDVLGPTNEYKPSLLLVSWDDEPLSTICGRLDIPLGGPQSFTSVTCMSLGRECVDVGPLKDALPETLKKIIRKPRFHFPLLPLVQAVYPLWTELLMLANSALERPDQDWLDFSVVLQLMIDSINDLRRVVLTTIAAEYSGRSLGIIKLPAFDGEERIRGAGHATSVLLKYLQQPVFAGMDDVSLLVPDVRDRLIRSSPPPTKLVLENLAYAVSSRLANCSLPLDVFDDVENQQARIQQLCEDARENYSSLVIGKAAVIERLIKSAPAPSPEPDVFTTSSDYMMVDTPIRALPDLSSSAALQQPVEPTPRKRRLETTASSDSTPSSERESKMLRLRKLMSQVNQDLAVSISPAHV